MDKKAIIKYCKELGCCDACCIRFLGYRNPQAYENTHKLLKTLLGPNEKESTEATLTERTSPDVSTTKLVEIDTKNGDITKENCENVNTCEIIADRVAKDVTTTGNVNQTPESTAHNVTIEQNAGNGVKGEKNDEEESRTSKNDSDDEIPAKRARMEVCFTCLGLLQEENWETAAVLAKDELEAKGYSWSTFSIALSPPLAVSLREHVVMLQLRDHFSQDTLAPLTSLKEAWKWSLGLRRLEPSLGLELRSGALPGLLLAFITHYDDDALEMSTLATQCKAHRIRNRRELDDCLSRLRAAYPLAAPGRPARYQAVRATHDPIYLGGRYIKLSRELPQTPWLVRGERMLPSSVQEVIFEPIAALCGGGGGGAGGGGGGLKLLAAGREDVDVRCLGRGRPFAVEIPDPRFPPSPAQLATLCAQISSGGQVVVETLRLVVRTDLAHLKAGEETKLKSYEALCIKLPQNRTEDASSVTVTDSDIARINALTPPALEISQRTPLRVLHRRPLHARQRRLLTVKAAAVPAHPRLLVLQLEAEAGTYIKEWVHGEAGRCQPALCDHLPVDILALDVTAVHLDWPPGGDAGPDS